MSERETNPLEQLKKLVIDQKKAFLPPEPANPSLAGLHQAVNDLDGLVSQVVIGALQSWPVTITEAETTAARAVVNTHLEQIDTSSGLRVELYQKYIERLDRMLALSREIIAHREA